MKRYNNLFEKIITMENLELAEKKARKGKTGSYGVKMFDKDRDNKLIELQNTLINKSYKTSEYDIFKIISGGKERTIYRLPYYPDRITHHAIMNIMEPIFVNTFTKDTYSCIKKRGIHLAARRLKNELKLDKEGTKYCLKVDIKKFYPSVNHDVLKALLIRKIKDDNLLDLLYEIIDSAEGIPIGNYLSQYFGNFMLAWFDHKVKEVYNIIHYFRYADDMVFLSDSKTKLKWLFINIVNDLSELDFKLKSNYQIFPVSKRGIDFVGYVFYHTHTRLRKSIKKNMITKYHNVKSRSSFDGWCEHCDAKHLIYKIKSNAKLQGLEHKNREKIYLEKNTYKRVA